MRKPTVISTAITNLPFMHKCLALLYKLSPFLLSCLDSSVGVRVPLKAAHFFKRKWALLSVVTCLIHAQVRVCVCVCVCVCLCVCVYVCVCICVSPETKLVIICYRSELYRSDLSISKIVLFIND